LNCFPAQLSIDSIVSEEFADGSASGLRSVDELGPCQLGGG
jgi:hypothetical protein